MTHPCPHCPGLRAENDRLLLEVAVLQRIIAEAQAECVRLANEADRKLADHLPTGVWAYASSQKETAEKVMRRLS